MKAGRGRGLRVSLSIAVMLPVILALLGAVSNALKPGVLREYACWFLPNGQVMTNPLANRCPVRLLETIRVVDAPFGGGLEPSGVGQDSIAPSSLLISVARGSEETGIEVPVFRTGRTERISRVAVAAIGSALMLSVPLFLLWRSNAGAAVPLTLFYGAASIVLTTLLAGQHSPWMTRAAVGGLILAPAALTHLAFSFPRERAILAEVPSLGRVPYLAAAALVPIGWVALERDPLLGPAFLSLLLALGAGAWAIVLFTCWLALRESESAMERARARLVFFGALSVPLAPTLAMLPATKDSAHLGVLYLWSAAATMPLPIALAISRYNLFDLGWDVRYAVVRVIYMGVAAVFVALVFGGAMALGGSPEVLENAAPLYLISFLCVVATEPLRTRIPGLLESVMAPRLRELRRSREDLEARLASLRDEDAISRSLGEALQTGVRARSGCVLLSTFGEWRSAYPFGDAPAAWLSLVEEAMSVLESQALVHLPADPEREARARSLRKARIEVIVSIGGVGGRYGIALVGRARRRSPYTGMEIDFIRYAATCAANALHHAQVTAELVAAERQATTGRLGVGLAHDLGKDLGWIRRLARRLPEQFDDEERLARDALMIRELSEGLADAVKRFVRDSTQQTPSEHSESLDRLIDRAVRRVSRVHGPDRVALNLEPALESMPFHEHLERVIGNLLDNALHASPPGAMVHLFGTLDGDVARITVEDRGCGIPEAMARRIFEAGVSSRLEEGGSGVGLTVASEIVESLGGTIRLEPGSESGTRATIRIPLRRQDDAPVP